MPPIGSQKIARLVHDYNAVKTLMQWLVLALSRGGTEYGARREGVAATCTRESSNAEREANDVAWCHYSKESVFTLAR